MCRQEISCRQTRRWFFLTQWRRNGREISSQTKSWTCANKNFLPVNDCMPRKDIYIKFILVIKTTLCRQEISCCENSHFGNTQRNHFKCENNIIVLVSLKITRQEISCGKNSPLPKHINDLMNVLPTSSNKKFLPWNKYCSKQTDKNFV